MSARANKRRVKAAKSLIGSRNQAGNRISSNEILTVSNLCHYFHRSAQLAQLGCQLVRGAAQHQVVIPLRQFSRQIRAEVLHCIGYNGYAFRHDFILVL
jgi:hypothetical protein